jgi:hypothetical protein
MTTLGKHQGTIRRHPSKKTGFFLKKDLQMDFFVLYLRYSQYIKQFCIRRFISPGARLKTVPRERRGTNKPFFMPARNVGDGGLDA